MAIENVKLGLALLLVAMLGYEATAQSGCTSALLGLAPCLNYIRGNSATPSSSCCSQLSSVVQSQPQCLCSALNGGGSSFGITINQTQALSLPGACKVQTPPVSQCNNAANGPAAPPANSAESPSTDTSDETPDTPDTSSVPSIPSGTGSKTVPTTEGSTSNGNSMMKMPLTLTLFTLLLASYISFIN